MCWSVYVYVLGVYVYVLGVYVYVLECLRVCVKASTCMC